MWSKTRRLIRNILNGHSLPDPSPKVPAHLREIELIARRVAELAADLQGQIDDIEREIIALRTPKRGQ